MNPYSIRFVVVFINKLIKTNNNVNETTPTPK